MKENKSTKSPLLDLDQLRQQYTELKVEYEKNIAEQKQAEKELKNSEARYKAIFESAGTATLIVDLDTSILMANKECLVITGYTSAELIGQKWTNYVAEESLQYMLKNHQLRRKNHDLAPSRYEVKLLNSKGEKRDAVLNINMIPGTKQSVVSMLDITEHKQAEEELRKNKSNLEEYFENDISANYVVSVSGEIFSCNKTFLSLFGFEKKSDIQKFDIAKLYKNPEDRQQIIRLIKQDRKVENYEVEFVSKEEKTIYALINAIGIFGKENKLEKIRGYVVDISEQKNTERELVKFKLSIERSFAAIFMTDVEGHIIFVNPAFEKLYGFTSDECIGKTPRILKSGIYNEDAYKNFWITLLSKNAATGEILNKTKKGSLITIDGYNTSILDSKGRITGFIGIHRDITEFKKQEEELIKSEEKYRLLFDNNPQPMWIYDLETLAFLEVNQAAISSYGYSRDEFLAMTLKDIRPVEDIPALLEDIKNTHLEYNLAGEWKHLKKNGEIIDVEIISHSLQFNDRNARYVLISDITERNIAKKALELALNELENLHNNLNDAIFSTDTVQNKMLIASSAHEQVFGYPPSMFFQNPQLWYELIIPEDKPIADAGYPVLFAGKDLMHELRIAHPSGQLRWIEARMKPKLDGNGKLVRVDGIVTDITARKIAEQELKKLSYAIEQSPVSVFITDLNGNIEYVNPKTLKISGYTKEELIGKNPRVFGSGEKPKKEYQQLWSTILSGNAWYGEFHNKRKNGELYWESASISPIFNNKHEIINYVAIKEDITGLKQFIEDLNIAKEKAEESDRLKSAFLANMSHEIRTPMNGILGFTNLLLEPDLSSEEKENFIKIVHQSGQRMLTTVTDIVEISKIEAGLVNVIEKETDLNEMVEELIRFFQLEAEEKGLNLILEKLLPVENKNVMTDQNKFDSILTNLIKNAIKYTDTGTIKVGCSQKGTEIEFYIKDTGIGIPAHRREAIFNRFEQADIADTRAFQGSGLGLAISKSYIEMLDGKIWVESEEGLGSTFYFTLPSKSNSAETQIADRKISFHNEQVKPKIKGLKILIAEDDEVSRQFISILINNFALEILEAKTGNEVIELCRNNKDIDLILMDIRMPGLDGYEATRRIREYNKGVVIIAQTAYAISGDHEKAIVTGCNDYISKPINKSELHTLIQKYFGK